MANLKPAVKFTSHTLYFNLLYFGITIPHFKPLPKFQLFLPFLLHSFLILYHKINTYIFHLIYKYIFNIYLYVYHTIIIPQQIIYTILILLLFLIFLLFYFNLTYLNLHFHIIIFIYIQICHPQDRAHKKNLRATRVVEEEKIEGHAKDMIVMKGLKKHLNYLLQISIQKYLLDTFRILKNKLKQIYQNNLKGLEKLNKS